MAQYMPVNPTENQADDLVAEYLLSLEVNLKSSISEVRQP